MNQLQRLSIVTNRARKKWLVRALHYLRLVSQKSAIASAYRKRFKQTKFDRALSEVQLAIESKSR